MNTSRKPIAGYEGIYEVTQSGEVIALAKYSPMPRGGTRYRPEIIMRPNMLRGGYLISSLYKEGVKQQILLHRIVCRAFHGAPPTDRHDVNHIDGVKTNNHASNLEWVTKSENIRHSFAVLGQQPSNKRKPVHSIDPATGEIVKHYPSVLSVAMDGYRPNNVSSCLNGRLKTTGKLKWSYTAEVALI